MYFKVCKFFSESMSIYVLYSIVKVAQLFFFLKQTGQVSDLLSSCGGSEPNLCLRDDDSRNYSTNKLFNSVNKIVLHDNLAILANDKMVW